MYDICIGMATDPYSVTTIHPFLCTFTYNIIIPIKCGNYWANWIYYMHAFLYTVYSVVYAGDDLCPEDSAGKASFSIASIVSWLTP